MEFENGFDFDGDVAGQRAHSYGTASADAIVAAKHVSEELGAAVDDGRVFEEIGRGVDHSQEFDQSADTIEAAQFGA